MHEMNPNTSPSSSPQSTPAASTEYASTQETKES
jgi:hypothetical protein